MICNIIYAIRKIKFSNHTESRFLFAVLLKFSQISEYTRKFLTKEINILLTLNILFFQKFREKNYTREQVFDIGNSYLYDTTHKILDPRPGITIEGERDKFTDINLKYDFLLFLNLSYEKENFFDDNKDPGFSFTNKNYVIALIKNVETKQEINYFSNLLKIKCLNNKEVFDNVLNTLTYIIDNVNDNDDSFYDKFEPENNAEIYKNSKKKDFGCFRRLRSNVHIIIINLFELKGDNLTEFRQKEIFSQLYERFKENKKYYSICLSIINIIIDIFSRSKEFAKKKSKQLNEIKEWLQKNKIAPKLYEIKGIEMYKDNPIHKSLFIDLKNITEVNQKLKDDFDKEEIKKTQKKIDLIYKISQGLSEKNDIEMDLNRYNFDIGENVIYANKKYEITEVFDEMIKIKGINEENDNKNLIFKVKGFKEKNQKGKNKEKECLWVEKDNYKLKIIE